MCKYEYIYIYIYIHITTKNLQKYIAVDKHFDFFLQKFARKHLRIPFVPQEWPLRLSGYIVLTLRIAI